MSLNTDWTTVDFGRIFTALPRLTTILIYGCFFVDLDQLPWSRSTSFSTDRLDISDITGIWEATALFACHLGSQRDVDEDAAEYDPIISSTPRLLKLEGNELATKLTAEPSRIRRSPGILLLALLAFAGGLLVRSQCELQVVDLSVRRGLRTLPPIGNDPFQRLLQMLSAVTHLTLQLEDFDALAYAMPHLPSTASLSKLGSLKSRCWNISTETTGMGCSSP
jgi:hypothetical protein